MTGEATASSPGVSIGIDIGGTFTDVVCATAAGSHILKLPTTRDDPGRAVLAALDLIRDRFAIPPSAITSFAHGTTIATNAVLERKGARVGLVTTKGFRDILEIGRQIRRQMYDLNLKPETPGWLAPGARRVEVAERIDATGAVLSPLDPGSLDAAVAKLKGEGVEAVAVALLFSFLAPEHERQVRAALEAAMPGVPVSISSEVDPVFREYERTVVTAFDAYVKPVVARYLANMDRDLAKAGVGVPLQIMQSRGGLAGGEVAPQRPVRLFLSGPAAGAIGGQAAGREAGLDNLITIDVGGTSSDIALIDRGRVLVKAETDIAGYQVRVPMLDVTTLGAGGGSIAWIDNGGGLRVGPQSAGADPGPACYGRGGTQATVTDASIVLGLLDPAFFVGGSMRLDPSLSHMAVEENVAKPLGMTVEAAALGIHRIANAHMADGIRLVSINRGYDPREFVLVPLGGAGGLHAVPLALELGIGRVLVPRYPGVLAAAGLLAAPIEHEVSGAFLTPIADARLADLAEAFSGLDRRAEMLMQAERIEGLARERLTLADIGYMGQSHYIEVPIDLGAGDPMGTLYRSFEAAHERLNGHKTGAPAKIVNLRVVHRAHRPRVPVGAVPPSATGRSLKGRRPVLFPGEVARADTAIHDRALIGVGERLVGPAIIEQTDSTTLLPPGWIAEMAGGAALLLTRSAS
ncbi:MAG: hydantoinase/oxoprolinase family protein [Hyphomicrobiaceae bacterium]|nr:hydantoinase/oxoprolinase family protein [Hyphomicrobiaceae bacterium]